jgi:hypothetical protein
MGELRNVYGIFGRKPERENRRKWGDNVNIDIKYDRRV